jgi:hypothetical protein
MKKCLVCSIVLFLALPGFTSANPHPQKSDPLHQPSRSSQFGVSRSGSTHAAKAKAIAHPYGVGLYGPSIYDPHTRPKEAASLARTVRTQTGPRRMTGSSTPAVSLVAGARTLLGGVDDENTAAIMGDFNGDGKPDVAKIVGNLISNVPTFQIAVLLGNGDGTFQTAVVTDTPSNTDDPIFAGDLKGSGTDDIIQVHPGSTSASIDVMISNGSGGFAAPVHYPIANHQLQGGVLTDVNGDGKLDVLVFDTATPANVIALLGNGDGTFQAATTLGQLTGAAPNNMVFADFNGDGNIDFAGYNSNNQIEVTLASGAGAYANAPVTLTASSGLYGGCNTATGDLTGDSKPEIVTFNCNGTTSPNTITVYVNNGDGSFAAGVDYDNNGDVNQNINNGTIADLDGDGNGDIIAINEGTSEISVFLGKGDGTVAVLPLRYAIGGFAYEAPLLADFNGDGLMDVVSSDDAYNLVYLQGYGEGTFKAASTYSLPNSFSENAQTFDVATGDFNGDGIPDVVVGQENNAGISVYLGKGDGTFSPGVSSGISDGIFSLAVGDFNGDGKLDVAAVDWNAQKVQIFLGNGDGTFTLGNLVAVDASSVPDPSGIAVGDFNKDGKLDLAVANSNGNLAVLLGNGDGTFAPFVSYPVGTTLNSVYAVDVNGDGFLDLVATGTNVDGGIVAILLGNSNGSGTFATPTTVKTDGSPYFAAFGDLNGDGNVDVAVAEANGSVYAGLIEVFTGNGTGAFTSPVQYQASTFGSASTPTNPGNIVMADMNGDGNQDLVYQLAWGTVAVALGNGNGTFAAPVEFPATEAVLGMALADLTGDGATDVIAGDNSAGGFSVLINGSGSAATPNYSIAAPTPTATVTAGSSGTYTLNVTGTNGYTGTVTFACTNLPAGSKCSFSPSSVTAEGAVPQTTTVTITTTAASAGLIRPRLGPNPATPQASPIFLASLAGVGLFGLVLVGSGRSRRAHILSALMMLLLTCTILGCSGSGKTSGSGGSGGGGSGGGGGGGGGSGGGGGTSGTSAGTYTVTVTSTGTGAETVTQTLKLTLVVQ